jgi:uncharacterized RDD family membrane protein YckC
MPETCPKCGFPEAATAECPRCGVDVARYREYVRSMGAWEAQIMQPAPPLRPAGFWIRAAALLLDSIVLAVVQWVVHVAGLFLWGEGVEQSRVFVSAARAFGVLFGMLYTVIFHWLWGQTFGKMAVRIRVVTVRGDPLTLRIAVLRELGYVVSAILLGIGYLMAGLRSDKRALHDLIAGTRVERM